MGSVWQALAFGFVGLRPLGGTLSVDPRLPGCVAGAGARVAVPGRRRSGCGSEPGVVSVLADAPVVIEVGERQVACEAGRTEIPYEVPGGSR